MMAAKNMIAMKVPVDISLAGTPMLALKLSHEEHPDNANTSNTGQNFFIGGYCSLVNKGQRCLRNSSAMFSATPLLILASRFTTCRT